MPGTQETKTMDDLHCSKCDTTFKTVKYKRDHLRRIHKECLFQCSTCEQRFFMKRDLFLHQHSCNSVKQDGQEPSGSSLECSDCLKTFRTPDAVKVHQHQLHQGPSPFPCGQCDAHFSRRSDWKIHQLVHTGEKPFTCHVCHSAFSQKSNLTSHIRQCHGQERRYQCSHCSKRFSRQRLLDYHLIKHTGQQQRYHCQLCDKNFSNPMNLTRHQKLHTEEKSFECVSCLKRFRTKDALVEHSFIHSTKPYRCDECGLNFIRKSRFDAHFQIRKHRLKTTK